MRTPFEAFRRIHAGMFGQVVVLHMFRDWKILTQICGNNFMVLKAAPPLVISDEKIESFIHAMAGVVDLMHSNPSFWTEALSMARRAVFA